MTIEELINKLYQYIDEANDEIVVLLDEGNYYSYLFIS